MEPSSPVERRPGHRAEELRGEHRRLDRLFTDLCERARTGDWQVCDEIWGRFARDLERHLRYEERFLFPAFARAGSPTVVEELCAEHAEIRSGLDALGVDIELKVVHPELIERFVATLRGHAARENEVFYPWLERRAGHRLARGGRTGGEP